MQQISKNVSNVKIFRMEIFFNYRKKLYGRYFEWHEGNKKTLVSEGLMDKNVDRGVAHLKITTQPPFLKIIESHFYISISTYPVFYAHHLIFHIYLAVFFDLIVLVFRMEHISKVWVCEGKGWLELNVHLYDTNLSPESLKKKSLVININCRQ